MNEASLLLCEKCDEIFGCYLHVYSLTLRCQECVLMKHYGICWKRKRKQKMIKISAICEACFEEEKED